MNRAVPTEGILIATAVRSAELYRYLYPYTYLPEVLEPTTLETNNKRHTVTHRIQYDKFLLEQK